MRFELNSDFNLNGACAGCVLSVLCFPYSNQAGSRAEVSTRYFYSVRGEEMVLRGGVQSERARAAKAKATAALDIEADAWASGA